MNTTEAAPVDFVGLIVHVPAWQRSAACAGEDAAMFYPDAERSERDYITDAKAVCDRCPVRQQCLDYALGHDEVGVWGGTITSERKAMLRRRARLADTPKKCCPPILSKDSTNAVTTPSATVAGSVHYDYQGR